MEASSLLLIVILLILTMIWGYRRQRKITFLGRHCNIPGPDPYFLIGNGPDLWTRNVHYVGKWIKEFGRVIAVYDFAPTVVVADPDLIRSILVKDFHLFSMRRTILPNGGFAADPDHEVSLISTDIHAGRWKEMRSLITTAFTSSKIRDSVPLVNDAIDDLLANLHQRKDDANIEV